jgi:hypothetical protein
MLPESCDVIFSFLHFSDPSSNFHQGISVAHTLSPHRIKNTHLIMRPFASGIKSDLSKRIPLYYDDWIAGWNPRVLAATLLIYFASIGPGITFASQLNRTTDGALGASEVIFSTAISGIIYSILGGQPLVIVGVT